MPTPFRGGAFAWVRLISQYRTLLSMAVKARSSFGWRGWKRIQRDYQPRDSLHRGPAEALQLPEPYTSNVMPWAKAGFSLPKNVVLVCRRI